MEVGFLAFGGDVGGVYGGAFGDSTVGVGFGGMWRMDLSCRDFGLSLLVAGVDIFSMDCRRVCWVRRTVGGAVLRS